MSLDNTTETYIANAVDPKGHYPAQCSCGHIFLEKYQFAKPIPSGAIGFAYCGFCRNKVMVFPFSVTENKDDL